jgi:hypothetical protein
MKSAALLSLLLFTALYGYTQKAVIDYAVTAKIKDEAFNRSQVMDVLFQLTDVAGPRLTGSSNLVRAQHYAKEKMLSWGLSNVDIEPWGGFGKGWEVQKCYAAITTPYYQPLIGMAKAWTPGTNGLLSAQTILVRVETEEDLQKYHNTLKGKIVVLASKLELKPPVKPDFRRYTDDDLHEIFLDKSLSENPDHRPVRDTAQMRAARQLRQAVAKFLVREEAAAIISSRGGSMGTFFTTNGASYAVNAAPTLPELETGAEHLNQLIRLLDAGQEVKLEIDIKTSFNEKDTLQYNVIAEIPGTDKKLKPEVVMIGAHLDSWHAATGATDNAAGSAVMMEVMRILKTIGVKPRRTIRIALWSAEEQGLHGSRGYVRNHFGDPVTKVMKPEHAKLSAYFNLDNGGGKVRGIYLQQNEGLRPLFETLLQPYNDLGATTVTNRNTGSTDHIAFEQVGLPGFQFIQDPLDYQTRTHHTNMDTYDRIQKQDLMQASAVIAGIVYHISIMDEKVGRKQVK